MIGAMMAMHIFETQTLRTPPPPPPPFWGSPEMVAPQKKPIQELLYIQRNFERR